MSMLSEIIVFLWLIPVLLNIVLPLCLFAVWPVLRVLGLVGSRSGARDSAATEPVY